MPFSEQSFQRPTSLAVKADEDRAPESPPAIALQFACSSADGVGVPSVDGLTETGGVGVREALGETAVCFLLVQAPDAAIATAMSGINRYRETRESGCWLMPPMPFRSSAH